MYPKLLSQTLLLLTLLSCLLEAGAAPSKPMLVPDTETIYQRVLTQPGQQLFDGPQGEAIQTLWPLQPVYVYQRTGDWLQVGRSVERGPEGWIPQSASVGWNSNIVGAFTNRGHARPRQIIFDSKPSLKNLLSHEAMLERAERYRLATEEGSPPEDSGVITIERSEYVNIEDKFYLMPILDFTETRHPMTRGEMLMMELASIPLQDEISLSTNPGHFRSGIVFVIDTTQSMAPFIEETLQAVKSTISQILEGDSASVVNFGLVGFRDDPVGRPGTDYRVKEFAKLRYDSEPEEILEKLENLEAMTTSTWNFEEDSFAGVKYAVKNTQWKGEKHDFAGRIVILITDAGPKAPNDPHAADQTDALTLYQLAKSYGVAIATVHIKSRAGRLNHDSAETAYRTISRFTDIPEEMYFPVDADDMASFNESLRGTVITLVNKIAGEMRIRVDQAAEQRVSEQANLEETGQAMRLAYLGRLRGQQAPKIIRGWSIDLSIEHPEEAAIEPRVLVTRNQLSTMVEIIRAIVQEGRRVQVEDRENTFFDSLRNVVVGIGGDGQRLVNSSFDTLGSAVGEFLEYLPYIDQSPIMTIDEVRWNNDSGTRTQILASLESKLLLYEDYYNTPGLWTKLYENAPDGEKVYALPFKALP